ncbi:MAG: hypothetical protein ACYTG2_12385 [Planctomycetota bacterium]|jgi:hypothetical protein
MYGFDFFVEYPTSETYFNVLDGTGKTCQICHAETSGGDGYNAYGWDIKQMVDGGMSSYDAIRAVTALDSDADETGSSNAFEVFNDCQPGWTPGAVNTIYFNDGSTLENQLPPAGILGLLDPDSPWSDLGNGLDGLNGVPILIGEGELQGGDPASITLTSGAPNAAAALVIGFNTINANFKGGVMVPDLDLLLLGLLTTGSGDLVLSGTWPNGVPTGFQVFLQYWITDAAGPFGFSASNGLSATQP